MIDEGVLSGVRGNVGFQLDVEQLIDLLGEPELVFSLSETNCTCDDGISLEQAPFETWMDLLYYERGAFFRLIVPFGQEGCVCPHTRVGVFEYVEPMSLQEYLDYKDYENLDFREDISNVPAPQSSDYVEWHGYGPGYGRPEQEP